MVAKKISCLSALPFTEVLYQPSRPSVPSDGTLQALEERDLRPPPQRLLGARDVAGPGVDGQVPCPALVQNGNDAWEPARLLGHAPGQHQRGSGQPDRADRA